MKKTLIALVALVLFVGAGAKLQAATSDQITITVTLEVISVSVTPDSWDIGVIKASETPVQDPCVATNDGNVTEDLTISVGNSGDWTVGTVAAENVFVLDYGPAGGDYTSNITAAGVSLKGNLDADATHSFGLEFNPPTSSTSKAQQTITVTISASATP
ncbi:MAG: hypothetical protein HQK83_19475 [Fibrobacteria bacterium]|nr:hypothetical protein [Fibrobacteria bacterium]